MQILAGDIGGTKTLLRLVDTSINVDDKQCVFEQRYPSQDYADLDTIIEAFLNEAGKHTYLSIESACFAVAGPVITNNNQQQAKVTNLPWDLDNEKIKNQFQFGHVSLINDFEAVGYGIAVLKNSDLLTVIDLPIKARSPKAILGAGTGLGSCQLFWQNDRYLVAPSEGGHVDFAPADSVQNELLDYMRQTHKHVSYDLLASGRGIQRIFKYLVIKHSAQQNQQIKKILESNDVSVAVANAQHNVELAKQTIDIFISIYAAHAGNMALVNLAHGGVYLAGGVTPKLLKNISSDRFRDAFYNKGRMEKLMKTFPVFAILNEQVGLLGAVERAKKDLH